MTGELEVTFKLFENPSLSVAVTCRAVLFFSVFSALIVCSLAQLLYASHSTRPRQTCKVSTQRSRILCCVVCDVLCRSVPLWGPLTATSTTIICPTVLRTRPVPPVQGTRRGTRQQAWSVMQRGTETRPLKLSRPAATPLSNCHNLSNYPALSNCHDLVLSL
jgi:hypothetical protein